MRQLPEITRNRTVICIAHRLNTLRQCHRILLLKDGQIAEQGSHEVLVASGGITLVCGNSRQSRSNGNRAHRHSLKGQ